MSPHQEIADRYIALWNDTDESSRAEAVRELFTERAVYSDPLAQVRGHDAINATIGAVQAQLPGMTMSLRGPVDAHNQQLRLTWGLGPQGGIDTETPVVGFDVIVIDDAKIDSVWGFIDRMPAQP